MCNTFCAGTTLNLSNLMQNNLIPGRAYRRCKYFNFSDKIEVTVTTTMSENKTIKMFEYSLQCVTISDGQHIWNH